MMTPDEMIAVIQAHKEGKQIQYFCEFTNKWEDVNNPCWDFNSIIYQIKPESPQPKYIPFTYEDAEQLIGKAVKDSKGLISLITDLDDDIIWMSERPNTLKNLFKDYTFFPSGEPCGKLVEE